MRTMEGVPVQVPKSIGVLASGDELVLPEEAVTQGFALLARRRSGKSVLAGAMEETFCRRGDPWVCLDPASAHWGIKYRDKDGQPGEGSGFDVLVVGGKYGDVPLEERMGAALAEIICETNISCVVDLKMASMGARKVFVTEFANRLFAINETPRHVFLEEAHEFVPQTPRWEEQKLVLGALERLIKGGGGQGIGFTLISQRPASVSKDVLTQIDNLFVLRMSGPRDLDAVKEWFEHNVGDREKLKAILATLPAFKPGDAWLLAPDWLGVMAQLRVRERVTYHAGRTPKRGERPVEPRRVDVSAVIRRFEKAATQRHIAVEQQKDLKAENARLRRELEKKVSIPADPNMVKQHAGALSLMAARAEAAEQRAESLAGLAMTLQRLMQEAADRAEASLTPLLAHLQKVAGEAQAFAGQEAALSKIRTAPPLVPSYRRARGASPREPHEIRAEEAIRRGRGVPEDDGSISQPQQRILDALAAFEQVGLMSVDRRVVAAYAGVSPRSSAYGNNLGRLRTGLGFIEYPQPAQVCLSAAGRQHAHAYSSDEPMTAEGLQQRWYDMLPRPQAAILRALVVAWPDDYDRDELAATTSASPSSSAYGNNLGRLRTMGLIEYPSTRRVKATGLLWPGGVPG